MKVQFVTVGLLPELNIPLPPPGPGAVNNNRFWMKVHPTTIGLLLLILAIPAPPEESPLLPLMEVIFRRKVQLVMVGLL